LDEAYTIRFILFGNIPL